MSTTIADLLLPEFDHEMATTRRVLERVPDDHAEWRPHEKTFKMAHLAQLVSRMPSWGVMTLERTEIDIAPTSGQSGFPGYSIEPIATLLAEFDAGAAQARAAIARTSDADFQVPWQFKRAGVTMVEMPRYMMLRTMTLNHLVHHRTQLAMYLRLIGLSVPVMYGPTADEGR